MRGISSKKLNHKFCMSHPSTLNSFLTVAGLSTFIVKAFRFVSDPAERAE